MTTATLIRTPDHVTHAPTTSDRRHEARTLRKLHARAGRLVAEAAWTPEVERAVHDLSTEIRRTVAELSGTITLVPSTPGDGTRPVVRFRELGVLQRHLSEALRGSPDVDSIRQAMIRTSALVDAIAGTLA